MASKYYEIRGGKRLAAFTKKILNSDDYEVAFGFLRPDKYPGGNNLTVSQVAKMHEYGTQNMPARPFFRLAVNSLKQLLPREMKKHMNSRKIHVIDQELATELGIFARNRVRQQIRWTTQPPLAPATVAHKGHAKVLIDTRHMINHVRYTTKRIKNSAKARQGISL